MSFSLRGASVFHTGLVEGINFPTVMGWSTVLSRKWISMSPFSMIKWRHVSVEKNTKISWDKWNCRKLCFSRMVLFLISQNVPFGCQFIYRKTLQPVAYVLYCFRENTGTTQCFKIFPNLKTQRIRNCCVLWEKSRGGHLYLIYSCQSVSLLGGPLLALTSSTC